jgi:hypothetical protein
MLTIDTVTFAVSLDGRLETVSLLMAETLVCIQPLSDIYYDPYSRES